MYNNKNKKRALRISERRRVFNEALFVSPIQKDLRQELAAVRMHLQKTSVEEPLQFKVKTYLRYIFERRRIQAKASSMP